MPNVAEIDYKRLVQELLGSDLITTTKDVSSTPSASYGHGPGGLFSSPGLNQRIFSAMGLPVTGMQSRLPVVPAIDTNPLYGLITGVTATTGTEPNGVCDDPPIAGSTKLCTHSFVFGRFSRATKVYDISRVGQIINRSDFTDLQTLGNPFRRPGQSPNAPTVFGTNPMARVGQTEIAKALFELAVAWSRDFARILYEGTPANNTGLGGYKEFWGFNYLINTGYQDAEAGQACPAADSQIDTFNGLNISTNGTLMVQKVASMWTTLRHWARTVGLDPATWVIAMPWSMFYQLTEIWPCNYLTYACSFASPQDMRFADAEAMIKMRDDMRGNMDNYSGQYLLIDGTKVPVVIDDAIRETSIAGGAFQSQMYFIPETVLGGVPVTYMEYFDFSAPGAAMDFAREFAAMENYMVSDGGRFLIHKKPPTNWCVQILALTSPRLLMLTPHIAGRIHSIQYTPYRHQRSTFPGDTYFYNGGLTDRVGLGPSFYNPIA